MRGFGWPWKGRIVPNIPAHIGLALEVAAKLEHPAVERHKGSFLLGSTTPDIRAMTKGDRETTHFAPFDSTELFAAVDGLFRTHRHLSQADRVSEATCAFVAGYISHLVADQVWVAEIYQPYFGNPAVYEDATVAKVMDRALQLEMDRQVSDRVGEIYPILSKSEEGVDVGFIDASTLTAWRGWVFEVCSRGFSWERLLFLARRRQDPTNHNVAQQAAEEFLQSVPRGLQGITQRVPLERVEAYRNRAVRESGKLAQEYLACV